MIKYALCKENSPPRNQTRGTLFLPGAIMVVYAVYYVLNQDQVYQAEFQTVSFP